MLLVEGRKLKLKQLDEAIDMLHQHVLKEGKQHHESAVEQLKDKHIANTIRKTLGIPDKDKEREE
ncbi:hypothetical protein BKA70DRAFT_1459232 [Coprinopsis sp. MPI-PUGE-AT-0042]|nr:hypothetical protein BKA70DRAFT_1459232 [Coprinopsis sp. MPI-PUGE-AT-0042]